MNGAQADGRRAGIAVPAMVVAGVLAALLVTRPWGSGGFDDDWNYAWMTREFSAHGRCEPNGWVEAMGGAQAVAGAAAIRLFGDTADVLRATVMLWHAGGVLALYALARRLGAGREMSALAASAYGVSPLAVPLAASYMTDAPGAAAALLTVLLGVVAFQRADAGRNAWPALIACAAAGYAAGTVRQIFWAVPFVILIAFAHRHRRRSGLLWGALLLAVSGSAAAWSAHSAFQSSPASLRDAPTGPTAIFAHKRETLVHAAKSALTFILLIAPVAWALWAAWRPLLRRPRPAILGGLLALAGAAVLVAPELTVPPWTGYTLNPWGVLGPASSLGAREELLPRWVRSAALAASLVPVAAWLAGRTSHEPRSHERGRTAAAAAMTAICAITAYRFLMDGLMPDRYFLPILALALVLLITHRDAAAVRRPSPIGWVAVAVFAAYGCAAAHDCFELLRARRRALDETVALGVERSRVYGGYELDGEYQLAAAGHIDNVVPAFTGPHGTCPPPSPLHERIWTLRLTPRVQPTHFVVTSLQDWLDPQPVLEVAYARWLPPGTGRVLVQRER